MKYKKGDAFVVKIVAINEDRRFPYRMETETAYTEDELDKLTKLEIVEIADCPFCHVESDGFMSCENINDNWSVFCGNCGYQSMACSSEIEAIYKHNEHCRGNKTQDILYGINDRLEEIRDQAQVR